MKLWAKFHKNLYSSLREVENFFFRKSFGLWNIYCNDPCFKNWPKLHKITHNFLKNRGSTPILTNLVGVHPRNNYNIWHKSVQLFGEDEKEVKKVCANDEDDARDTLTHLLWLKCLSDLSTYLVMAWFHTVSSIILLQAWYWYLSIKFK